VIDKTFAEFFFNEFIRAFFRPLPLMLKLARLTLSKKEQLIMKIVGRRKDPKTTPLSAEWDEFVKLAEMFRADQVFVPRGVYKFKTFEEANRWSLKMMLGKKPIAGRQQGKTSRKSAGH